MSELKSISLSKSCTNNIEATNNDTGSLIETLKDTVKGVIPGHIGGDAPGVDGPAASNNINENMNAEYNNDNDTELLEKLSLIFLFPLLS